MLTFNYGDAVRDQLSLVIPPDSDMVILKNFIRTSIFDPPSVIPSSSSTASSPIGLLDLTSSRATLLALRDNVRDSMNLVDTHFTNDALLGAISSCDDDVLVGLSEFVASHLGRSRSKSRSCFDFLKLKI